MDAVTDKILSKEMVCKLLGLTNYEFVKMCNAGLLRSYQYLFDRRRRYFRLSEIIVDMEGSLGDYLGWRVSYIRPRLEDLRSYVRCRYNTNCELYND